MSIRRRWVGVLAVAAVLGFCESASAQGPGGRGGPPQQRGMSGGGMQGGCAPRMSSGPTSTQTLTTSRQAYPSQNQSSPAQMQYAQLVANQQMQAWYANYYAEQAAYKVYLDNLLRRDAERRAARQLQTGN
jgi:hypothetical protein